VRQAELDPSLLGSDRENVAVAKIDLRQFRVPSTLRELVGCEQGDGLIEFALVAGVLFICLFGIMGCLGGRLRVSLYLLCCSGGDSVRFGEGFHLGYSNVFQSDDFQLQCYKRGRTELCEEHRHAGDQLGFRTSDNYHLARQQAGGLNAYLRHNQREQQSRLSGEGTG